MFSSADVLHTVLTNTLILVVFLTLSVFPTKEIINCKNDFLKSCFIVCLFVKI